MALAYVAGMIAIALGATTVFVSVRAFLESRHRPRITIQAKETTSKRLSDRLSIAKNIQGSLAYSIIAVLLRALSKFPTPRAWSNYCAKKKLSFLKDYELCLNSQETARAFSAQIVLMLILSLAFWPIIGLSSVIFGLLIIFIPMLVLAGEKKRIRHASREALIEFVEQLIDALKANKSLQQAISMSAPTGSEALNACVQRALTLCACGVSAPHAFAQAVQETALNDAIALGAALEVHAKTGGNLTVLLQDFASQYRQSLLFEQNLKTQTAQGRLSVKVVAIIPPLLVAGLNIISPGYFQAFLASPSGRTLFYGAVALNVIGLLLIQRIMRVEGVD